ncbi:MAG: hypothetical protein A3F67_05940 [Verrucomicrobia bacterium RIFCSPHIGHO2_12_FULL_41_10]|nr:MAG: hypothetical protein A3F67_05940 [Verrucomicrobia bacterium RIFCSPHIGHO2_12_FULL_41_10]HLB34797.1 small ribosomal subunit Rsm22 family protein [Chthoniobacterales bacterium]
MTQKINLTSNDWERLRFLRQRFLNDASENYWEQPRDLELYDLIYAQRIAWKWNAVLTNLSDAGWKPTSEQIIDWGCGTGIASRTTSPWSGIKKVGLIDQSALSINFTKKQLDKEGIETISWPQDEPLEEKSLFLISHVLGELNEKELLHLATIAATAHEIIWVEPGSHELSRKLSTMREIFINAGHHLIAPCVHKHPCPMLQKKQEHDWCHFFAKPPIEIFQSSFWHKASRQLGIDLRSLPYSYLAFSRVESPSWPSHAERLIGHPRKLKAHCKLLCCGSDGLVERTLQRRDHPELFRKMIRNKEEGIVIFGQQAEYKFKL